MPEASRFRARRSNASLPLCLAFGDVDQLRALVPVQVAQVHGHGLAVDWQGRGKGNPPVLQVAAANLLLLLGENVNFILAVVVEVGESNDPAAEQTRKGLTRAQARTTSLAIEPDLGVRGSETTTSFRLSPSRSPTASDRPRSLP